MYRHARGIAQVALMRLASVPYDLTSTDRRAHITNKWIQTGWEVQNELTTLDDLERLTSDWPPYASLLDKYVCHYTRARAPANVGWPRLLPPTAARLLTTHRFACAYMYGSAIVPLMSDLSDAVTPLLASGLRAQARGNVDGATAATTGDSPVFGGGGGGLHFELVACDLVVSADSAVHLMEVNVNPAFGTFLPRTEAQLIQPLFDDVLRLCVLPAAGATPTRGRFRQVRARMRCHAVTSP